MGYWGLLSVASSSVLAVSLTGCGQVPVVPTTPPPAPAPKEAPEGASLQYFTSTKECIQEKYKGVDNPCLGEPGDIGKKVPEDCCDPSKWTGVEGDCDLVTEGPENKTAMATTCYVRPRHRDGKYLRNYFGCYFDD